MWMLKRKFPYSQLDVKEQQAIVMEAINQRDAVSGNVADLARASTTVEVAQEILNYMLEEIEKTCQ